MTIGCVLQAFLTERNVGLMTMIYVPFYHWIKKLTLSSWTLCSIFDGGNEVEVEHDAWAWAECDSPLLSAKYWRAYIKFLELGFALEYHTYILWVCRSDAYVTVSKKWMVWRVSYWREQNVTSPRWHISTQNNNKMKIIINLAMLWTKICRDPSQTFSLCYLMPNTL